MRSRLETIVDHDGRLDLLCCLLDEELLSVPQISARIGESLEAVRHWVDLLESFAIVEKREETVGEEPLYAATLDDHPRWVRDAVRRHRTRAS